MKKIALIGTHGVRKTTHAYGIAHRLKELGYNSEFLGEIARQCPFPINEETTKDAQLWILHTQIAKELEAKKHKPDYLVCDRASVDNYAYYVAKFGNNKTLDELVREHVKTYSVLFRVPIKENCIESDFVRSINPEFQKKIDNTIKDLITYFGITLYDFINLESSLEIIKNS